jgi:hypothetical protein
MDFASHMGLKGKLLNTFLESFSIDDGLMDDELSLPPKAHRDSMVGTILKLARTKDAKMSEDLLANVGAAMKVNSAVRRRVQDPDLKLWTPAFTAMNTPRAIRSLSDEQLLDYVVKTRDHVHSMPALFKVIFDHLV